MTLPFSFTTAQIPKSFLKSRMGRQLGVHGRQAQLLGMYLLCNPYLHTSGHYALPLTAVIEHTGIAREALYTLLLQLTALGFCEYDWEAEWVYVPLVTQIYTALWGKPSPIASTEGIQPLSEEEKGR